MEEQYIAIPFLLRTRGIWCGVQNSLLPELKKQKCPSSSKNTFLVFAGCQHTNCERKLAVQLDVLNLPKATFLPFQLSLRELQRTASIGRSNFNNSFCNLGHIIKIYMLLSLFILKNSQVLHRQPSETMDPKAPQTNKKIKSRTPCICDIPIVFKPMRIFTSKTNSIDSYIAL